jgi:ribosomal protein S18 acetylase RimI-like enzyme
LGAEDLPAVLRVQEEAYPWHQEELDVFRDRLALYPAGCLALDDGEGVQGYAISHPWHAASPPPLDALLRRLPEQAGTYYLHDVALLKQVHGRGHAAAAADILARHAAAHGFASMSLVAVNNSAAFWQRRGFLPAMTPELAAKLATYGADAIFMTRALAPEEAPSLACPPPFA